MSLTWGGIKRLVRLQAVAQQLAVIAQQGEEAELPTGTFARMLDDLIDEAYAVLRDADPGLAEEFARIAGKGTFRSPSHVIRARLLAGWLHGTVEAETLEVRIRMGDGGPRPRTFASTRDNGG